MSIREKGVPVGLTPAIKAKFKSDLADPGKTPTVHVSNSFRRLCQWAASGHYPTGLDYSDVKAMAQICVDELHKRDPKSTADMANFPPQGRSLEPAFGIVERCQALTDALTDAASDSEGNDTRSGHVGGENRATHTHAGIGDAPNVTHDHENDEPGHKHDGLLPLPTPRSLRQGAAADIYQPQTYHAEADETVKCPECGLMNANDARYCDQCGRAIPNSPVEPYDREDDEDVQCPKCNRFNDDDAMYCDQCGTELAGRSDVTPGRSRGPWRPARDQLVRGVFPLEVREGGSGAGTLYGHFAVFNRWTKIDSLFEGTFMERVAPGAFKKTLAENRGNIRCLFNHGKDPSMGDQALGRIESLAEDRDGAAYEVALYDGIPPLVMSGLRDGQYGASFRFSVMDEDFNARARPSDYNPDGLPERTIRQAQVMEFGPVTFPAYPEATAAVRSLTDDYLRTVVMPTPPQITTLAPREPAPAPRAVAKRHPAPAGRSKPQPRHVSVDEFITLLEKR
jgi:HK97 family phage prohead protease